MRSEKISVALHPMKSIVAVLLLISPLAAATTIYKHVDANGTITYSNIPMRGAKAIQLSRDTSGAPAKPPLSAANIPAEMAVVHSSIQQQRDGGRRKILQQELSNEEQALQQAKLVLEQEEANPTSLPDLAERIRRLKDAVTDRERNIAAIRNELTRIPSLGAN